MVLKWDKVNEPKGKHSKFQSLWLGPFQVVENIGVGTYRLQNLRGELDALPVNGQAQYESGEDTKEDGCR